MMYRALEGKNGPIWRGGTGERCNFLELLRHGLADSKFGDVLDAVSWRRQACQQGFCLPAQRT